MKTKILFLLTITCIAFSCSSVDSKLEIAVSEYAKGEYGDEVSITIVSIEKGEYLSKEKLNKDIEKAFLFEKEVEGKSEKFTSSFRENNRLLEKVIKMFSDKDKELIKENSISFNKIVDSYPDKLGLENFVKSIHKNGLEETLTKEFEPLQEYIIKADVLSDSVQSEVVYYGYINNDNGISIYSRMNDNESPGIKGRMHLEGFLEVVNLKNEFINDLDSIRKKARTIINKYL